MSDWAGFWIFMAVFVVCDTYAFVHGYDTLLQRHETAAEIELQRLIIEEKRSKLQQTPAKPSLLKGKGRDVA